MGIVKSLVLAMLIIAGLVVGLGQIYLGVSSQYGQVNVTDPSTQMTNPQIGLNQTMSEMEKNVENIATPTNWLGAVYNPVMLLLNTVKLITSVPGVIIGMVNQMSISSMGIPIPGWVLVTISLVLVAIFVFAIMQWVTGREL